MFIVASAVELIEFMIRVQGKDKNLKDWKERVKFQLLTYDGSNQNEMNYEDIEFSHFIESDAPTIKNVVNNIYYEKLSLTVVGYSGDSSQNSAKADLDTFTK